MINYILFALCILNVSVIAYSIADEFDRSKGIKK